MLTTEVSLGVLLRTASPEPGDLSLLLEMKSLSPTLSTLSVMVWGKQDPM